MPCPPGIGGARLPPMRAGEVADRVVDARLRRPRPAPILRALAVLVVLAVMLLGATGAIGPGAGSRRESRPRQRSTQVLGAATTRPPITTTTTPSTRPVPHAVTTAVIAPAIGPEIAGAVTPPTVSCAEALAYLAAHQAPGYTDTCGDGSAQGHLGYTCADTPGRCEGQRFVRIACPAPFVYQNEAHNSWTLIGARTGIDPYGQGSASERAACAAHR